MKLFFSKIVVCILLSSTFLSCSNDDDTTAENPIVGTWRLVSQNFDGSPVTLNNCDLQFTVTYTETQSTLTSYNTSNDTCIADTPIVTLYKIEGNQLVFIDSAGNVLEEGVQTVFVIENDSLTVTVSRPNDPEDQIDINTFIKVTN